MEIQEPCEIENLLNKPKKVEENVYITKIKTSDITYFSLYRYSTICERMLLVFALFLAVITGLGPPLQAFLAGDVTGGTIINYATLQYNLTNSSEKEVLDQKFRAETKRYAIMASSVGLGTIILSYVVGALFSHCALAQVTRIRKLYIKKILNMDIEWFELNNTGDFATSFTENLTYVEDAIGEKMGLFLTYQSTVLVGMVMVLIAGWNLALVALIHCPLSLIVMAGLSWLTGKIGKAELEAYSSAGCVAEEVLGSIRTVVAFGGQKKELERYNKYVSKAKERGLFRNILLGTGNGILMCIAYSSIALTFWYGVKLMQEDNMKPEEESQYTPAVLMSIFSCTLTVTCSISQAIPYIGMFSIAKEKIEKIYKILSTEPKINTYKKKGVELKNINGDIVFDDVLFKYPSRPDMQVLNGFNLQIKKGETTALVGSSGCGKSTCIQLIQRFYNASSGNVSEFVNKIFIDGHNINDLNIVSLRSHISVVGQEPVLFSTTIAENIRHGRLDATQEDIEKAARRASAHQFIKALPQGYQTAVGGTGFNLSGGQKQRIAIARALIREPSILLLDEATSALDTTSEAEVQAAIDQIKGECTTVVVVAHRLSTIKKANKIVVVSEGRVIEQGTHSQLVHLRGAYYELVKHQGFGDAIQHGGIKLQATSESMESLSIESKHVHSKESSTSLTSSSKGVKKATLFEILTMNKPELRYILMGCMCSILIGTASPVYGLIFTDIIVLLVNRNLVNIISQLEMHCLYLLAIGGVLLVTGFLQGLAFGISGENLTLRLRNQMFETMLKQDVGWFDEKENGIGALCARLSVETSSVQGALGVCPSTILNALLSFVIGVSFSMYFEWRLALVILALSPFLFFVTYLSIKLEAGDAAGNQKDLERYSEVALEAAVNIKTVASLSCENVFYEKFLSELVPYMKKAKKSLNNRAAVLALNRIYMPFVDSAVIPYAAVLMTNGMPYSTYFKTTEVIVNGCISLGSAFSFFVNFQKGVLAAGRICEFLRRPPAIRTFQNVSTQPWEESHVEYKDVSFSYPARKGLCVLRGLNLSVAPGSTVALVGSSGCGKSTIVQLLQRFYEPAGGKVTVDKRDIRNVDLPTLRSRLGIVSQEPNLFNRTIAENIAYGNNDREVSMQEVIKAAKDANIHDFVSTLPSGYETFSGANGIQLSGGQKQRVAIARALIREPTILLLDEATSALDGESEKVVQEALSKATMGRTCITIAHRLTTIQDADLICVVKDGAVAEKGTHDELMDKQGYYYEFYKLQSVST